MNIAKAPFFENSVRCFFPLAALSAVLGPAYLVTVIINQYPFEHPFFTVFEWHAFEMLFGFLFTLVAGFILTAGGHWTGKGPLSGAPLALLFFVWFLDKFALFLPMPSAFYLLAAALFPALFVFQLAKLLKGYRQFKRFIVLIGLLGLAKLLYLAGALYEQPDLKMLAERSVLFALIMLVSVIGGRVTPRFTKNYFNLDKVPAPPKPFEKAVFAANGLILVWLLPLEADWPAALAFALAGALNLVRAGFYKPGLALRRPILGMLHLGYIVYAVSLIYIGLAQLAPAIDMGRGSLHLLTTGGFSIIAINIIVRASLGHTGRPIKLSPMIAAIFACIVIGALLRAFIPPIWPELYFPSLHYSMGFWTLGFVLYLIKFLPIVFKARADA